MSEKTKLCAECGEPIEGNSMIDSHYVMPTCLKNLKARVAALEAENKELKADVEASGNNWDALYGCFESIAARMLTDEQREGASIENLADLMRESFASIVAAFEGQQRENQRLKEYSATTIEGWAVENKRLLAELEAARAKATGNGWMPIETAPKDGSAILLLSAPYKDDTGTDMGVIHHAAAVAIGQWKPDGTSWVDEDGRLDGDAVCDLAVTGIWLSGRGWFQPNEVTHWQPLPALPAADEIGGGSKL